MLYEALRDDFSLRVEVAEALGIELLFQSGGSGEQQEYKIAVRQPLGTAGSTSDADQLAWLQRAANAMINALRPRLERLLAESSQ